MNATNLFETAPPEVEVVFRIPRVWWRRIEARGGINKVLEARLSDLRSLNAVLIFDWLERCHSEAVANDGKWGEVMICQRVSLSLWTMLPQVAERFGRSSRDVLLLLLAATATSYAMRDQLEFIAPQIQPVCVVPGPW